MIYKILLVDDEVAIVDWLQYLISESLGESVEVYKTTNPFIALKMLSTAKFDIAVLDINMPAMSGIHLLDEMADKYPETKIIFLTGFQQFEYARKALNRQVIAYVLKDEEDDILLEALNKAMTIIKEDIEQQELIESAKRKLNATAPMLKKEFIMRLVQGLISPNEVKEYDKVVIKFNVSPEKPMCLLICTISNNMRGQSIVDRINSLFTAGLALEEAMSKYFVYEYTMIDENSLVWLIQNKDGREWGEESYSSLRAVFENTQIIYNRNTQDNLIFIYGKKAKVLDEVSEYYMKIRPLLGYAISDNHVVLTDEDLNDKWNQPNEIRNDLEHDSSFNKAPILQRLLEQGEKDEYFSVLEDMLLLMKSLPNMNNPSAAEAFMTVSGVLLSYMNKTSILEKVSIKFPVNKLYYMGMHQTGKDASEYLFLVSSYLFQVQSSRKATRSEHIIDIARDYIIEHLNEELSLIMLADKVYLNPSYFSVLFKTKTGMNVSEFIKNERIKKAKSLLQDKKYRINEIAKMIGYNNAAYFTKFFKAQMGISPQEYRDNVLMQHKLI